MKIKKTLDYELDGDTIESDAKGLLVKALKTEPKDRASARKLKRTSFFEEITFENLHEQDSPVDFDSPNFGLTDPQPLRTWFKKYATLRHSYISPLLLYNKPIIRTDVGATIRQKDFKNFDYSVYE